MAEQDIIQNMIHQLGQSQADRRAPELDPQFAKVDERTPEDLLLFARALAAHVNYHDPLVADPVPPAPMPDWTPFFPYDAKSVAALAADESGNTPPHLALLIAFLRLYGAPQKLANELTARHLDLYYRRILKIANKGPIADRAHLILELKKGVAPVAVGPERSFSAGKDSQGVELVYAPTGTTIINSSKIDSLRSIYLDKGSAYPKGLVRCASVANSDDGAGAPLPADDPKWFGFGSPLLPVGPIGFAVSSPVLRMREGARKIRLRLTLSSLSGLTDQSFAAAFQFFVTGAGRWLGPYPATVTTTGDNVEFTIDVPAVDPAVTDYDPRVHGHSFGVTSPVLQARLEAKGTSLGYSDFQNLLVQSVSLAVEVEGIKSLILENDSGSLDPHKAFQPFGPTPSVGSRFMIGCPEALSKKLSSLRVAIAWKDVPANLAAHYSGYSPPVTNDSFHMNVSYQDAGGTAHSGGLVRLFDSADATTVQELDLANNLPTPAGKTAFDALNTYLNTSARWAANQAKVLVTSSPTAKTQVSPPPLRPSFISFALTDDFRYSAYRDLYVQAVISYGVTRQTNDKATLTLPGEPYTPAIKEISLSYNAEAADAPVGTADTDELAFALSDIQFFHVDCFGQRLEHAMNRSKLRFLAQTKVPLLPEVAAGRLLIGLTGAGPGDSVSLLVQTADGSADPEAPRQPVTWSVLCENYWRTAPPDELVLDTTDGLLRSGIVRLLIPDEATLNNTLLPADRLWISASLADPVTSVSQLIGVETNALEVSFVDRGNEKTHLESALPAGKISKLRAGPAEVKSARQPYASFGGAPAETNAAYYTRVSERLRHKNRCITPWDYERIVLEAFPKVHKVKCIPHASATSWLAPGHVMLVVIPDLRNRNAVNPLQPKADAETLAAIADYLAPRAGQGLELRHPDPLHPRLLVKNPTYRRIRFQLGVHFRSGFEFNYYHNQLNATLRRALSPWAFDSGGADIAFGGRIFRSALLDLVEHLEYVDYVTAFEMFMELPSGAWSADLSEAAADQPDAILVSDDEHTINHEEA